MIDHFRENVSCRKFCDGWLRETSAEAITRNGYVVAATLPLIIIPTCRSSKDDQVVALWEKSFIHTREGTSRQPVPAVTGRECYDHLFKLIVGKRFNLGRHVLTITSSSAVIRHRNTANNTRNGVLDVRKSKDKNLWVLSSENYHRFLLITNIYIYICSATD